MDARYISHLSSLILQVLGGGDGEKERDRRRNDRDRCWNGMGREGWRQGKGRKWEVKGDTEVWREGKVWRGMKV